MMLRRHATARGPARPRSAELREISDISARHVGVIRAIRVERELDDGRLVLKRTDRLAFLHGHHGKVRAVEMIPAGENEWLFVLEDYHTGRRLRHKVRLPEIPLRRARLANAS